MGHAAVASDMSAVHRQCISDDRLRAVVETARSWLFGTEDEPRADQPAETARTGSTLLSGTRQVPEDSHHTPLHTPLHLIDIGLLFH